MTAPPAGSGGGAGIVNDSVLDMLLSINSFAMLMNKRALVTTSTEIPRAVIGDG
jgi:hypothetical protein